MSHLDIFRSAPFSKRSLHTDSEYGLSVWRASIKLSRWADICESKI